MSILYKRSVKLSLCFLLIFTVFLSIFAVGTLQPKADAFAITATTATLSVVTWILGMLGISFASAGGIAKASQQFYDDSTGDVRDAIDYLALQFSVNASTGVKTLLLAGGAALAAVTTVTKAAWNYFKRTAAEPTIELPSESYGTFGDVKVVTKSTFADAKDAYNCASYDINGTPTLTVNGVTRCYTLQVSPNNGLTNVFIMKNGVRCSNSGWNPSYASGFSSFVDAKFGFMFVEYVAGYFYLMPYIAVCYLNTVGIRCYSYYIGAQNSTNYTNVNTAYACPVAGDGVTPDSVPLPYDVAYDAQLNEILIALQSLKEQIANGMTIAMDEPYTDVVNGKEEVENPEAEVSKPLTYWLNILSALGILDMINAKDRPISTEGESDFDVPNLPNLADKFPFCVPFDLVHLIGALNAPAQDPVWSIPFSIPSLGINESFDFDLTQFETVAQVIRVFVVLFFILGLILITRKLIQA